MSNNHSPMPVRTRYAPSPTGEPHVGNIRTALFAWLMAEANDGVFILRIEDTDQSRKQEGAIELQMEALRWLGVEWDEGPDVGGPHAPYVQSERLSEYQTVAERLVSEGNAYECFCSPERLSEVRKVQEQRKQHPGYDRRCRNLTADQRDGLRHEGVTPAIRFKMPVDGDTIVQDIIRDEVTFKNELLDDFVIIKSDGYPTYHLAHIVDDHMMEISHVIRAEEWLPSLPRHFRLYEALGWERPAFAHVPNILAPDRSKLSKRHGATSALQYREMGYLPDSMLNFLVLLGWSLDDRTEILSRSDLKRHFSLERVSRSPAIFQTDKLEWMNGQYIKNMKPEDLADTLLEHWGSYPPVEIPASPDRDILIRIAPLISERLKTLPDAASLIAFFFKDEIDYDPEMLIQKGMDHAGTKSALQAAVTTLSGIPDFDSNAIEGVLRPLADDLGLKIRQLLGALRIATTGQKVAPPLFESMEIVGRDRTILAVEEAITRL